MEHSPEQVNPKHVVERDIQNLLEILNQASNVKRYSRDFMVKEENLLEHIGFTVMFAAVIGRRLQANGVLVSMSVLLESAAFHDMEEILTGDVPRPTKYSSPEVKKGLHDYEVKCVRRLEEVLKIKFEKVWAASKDTTIEGRIVALADVAAVVYKTMVEVSMFGNKSFLRVSEEIQMHMEGLMTKINEGDDSDQSLLWVIIELYNILIRSRRGELQFGHFFKGV